MSAHMKITAFFTSCKTFMTPVRKLCYFCLEDVRSDGCDPASILCSCGLKKIHFFSESIPNRAGLFMFPKTTDREVKNDTSTICNELIISFKVD